PQVPPALRREPDGQLPRPQGDFLPEREILRPLADLDESRTRGELNLASAVDVGVFPVAVEEVAAHVLVRAGGEIRQAAERAVIRPVRTGEADTHRRRLPGGRVVDADVHGLHGAAYWYWPPAWSRMRRNASAAFGNRSGPVTPPVGPPPSRCGSSVANPSYFIATASAITSGMRPCPSPVRQPCFSPWTQSFM